MIDHSRTSGYFYRTDSFCKADRITGKSIYQDQNSQSTSMRPGPYTVALATESVLLKVVPAPFTNAAMVNPFAKPDSNGKLAWNWNAPATGVTLEMGTATGRFCPERYTIELLKELTDPGTENSSVMFFASGVVRTVSLPNVVSLISGSGCGHEPFTMKA